MINFIDFGGCRLQWEALFIIAKSRIGEVSRGCMLESPMM
jgi:hypothetical protein